MMRQQIPEAVGSFTNTSTETNSGSERKVMNRRKLLKITGATSFTMLAGCTGGDGSAEPTLTPSPTESTSTDKSSNSKPFEGETLTVSIWSGNYTNWWKNYLKPMYEEETGGTLKLVPGWSEIIANIKAAPKDDPPYDVTITEGAFYLQGRSEDLFLNIEDWDIPNLNDVWDPLLEFRPATHGVPVDGEPTAIMYNNEKLDYEIEGWQDMIDKQTPVTLEGGFYAYMMHIVAQLVDKRKLAEEVYFEEDWDLLFDKLGEFNIASWYSSGAEAWSQFKQQIALASMWYLGGTLKRQQNNDWVTATLPDKTSGYFDHFCPVRGTDKKEMAQHFLNWLLRPDVQTKISEVGYQLVSNKKAEHLPIGVEYGYPTKEEDWNSYQFPNYERLQTKGLRTKLSTRYQTFQKT